MTQFIEESWIDEMTDFIKKSREDIDGLKKDRENTKSVELEAVFGDLIIANLKIHILGIVLKATQLTINKIGDALDKLPNRSEFDAVRQELTDSKKLIKEAVIPLKEALEEGRIRESRGDTVYG